MGGIDGVNETETKDAPVYFGGEDERLTFIDNRFNRERDNFDDFIMDALIASGINENCCPVAGEWVHLCFVKAIEMAVTGHDLIVIPKNFSPADIEKLSWGKLWHLYDTGQLQTQFNEIFSNSLLRLFILRHHTVDGPDRPYNMSYFVKRWGFSLDLFPDILNYETCNVRLEHLKRGKKIFKGLSGDTRASIKLLAKFLPLILKKVNIAIKQ